MNTELRIATLCLHGAAMYRRPEALRNDIADRFIYHHRIERQYRNTL